MEATYKRWQATRSDADFNELMLKAKPIIDTAVKTYVGFPDPVANSYAKILAAKAFRTFELGKKTKLQSHIYVQLQPLRRLAAARNTPIKVPEQVQYDMSGIVDARTTLEEELGRPPTDIELADKTGLSKHRVRYLQKYGAAPIPEGMRIGLGGEPQATPTSEAKFMDSWIDYVYTDLAPSDRAIFEWKTGYGGKSPLSVTEIAKRLNISPGAVTQRADKISKKIEEGLRFGDR